MFKNILIATDGSDLAAKAHALLERGDAATATRVDCGGQFPYRRSAAPEAVHIAFFGLLVAGDAAAALSAVLAHWCRCFSRDLRSRSR